MCRVRLAVSAGDGAEDNGDGWRAAVLVIMFGRASVRVAAPSLVMGRAECGMAEWWEGCSRLQRPVGAGVGVDVGVCVMKREGHTDSRARLKFRRLRAVTVVETLRYVCGS